MRLKSQDANAAPSQVITEQTNNLLKQENLFLINRRAVEITTFQSSSKSGHQSSPTSRKKLFLVNAKTDLIIN